MKSEIVIETVVYNLPLAKYEIASITRKHSTPTFSTVNTLWTQSPIFVPYIQMEATKTDKKYISLHVLPVHMKVIDQLESC